MMEVKKGADNFDDRIKLIQLTHGIELENGDTLKYKYGLFLGFGPIQYANGRVACSVRGKLYEGGEWIASIALPLSVPRAEHRSRLGLETN